MYMRICEKTRQDGRTYYDHGTRQGASVHLANELRWLLADEEAYRKLTGKVGCELAVGACHRC